MELETPKIGGKDDHLIAKFEFDDLLQQKKRRVSCHRRDSRIGMLIGKSSKCKRLLS